MIKTLNLILALALMGMAQTKPADLPKPAQPPVLEIGKKLAMAQRDYVASMSKLQSDQAEAQKASDALKALTAEAEKACGGKEWVLDQMAAECVAKPPASPTPTPAGISAMKEKDGGAK